MFPIEAGRSLRSRIIAHMLSEHVDLPFTIYYSIQTFPWNLWCLKELRWSRKCQIFPDDAFHHHFASPHPRPRFCGWRLIDSYVNIAISSRGCRHWRCSPHRLALEMPPKDSPSHYHVVLWYKIDISETRMYISIPNGFAWQLFHKILTNTVLLPYNLCYWSWHVFGEHGWVILFFSISSNYSWKHNFKYRRKGITGCLVGAWTKRREGSGC